MEKLSIKLKNGHEMEIDSVVENNNVVSKMLSLTLRIPLKQAKQDDISGIKENITPENMSNITVLFDGEPMNEFSNYTVIRNIDTTINKFEQFISVSATAKD